MLSNKDLTAVLYPPIKAAMQSGKRSGHKWLIEFVMPFAEEDKHINNLMGWLSSKNTVSQLRLEFATKEEAIRCLKSTKVPYRLAVNNSVKKLPHSYTSKLLRRKGL